MTSVLNEHALRAGHMLNFINIMEPKEIADHFNSKGIKGKAFDPECCPVAVFLNENSEVIHQVDRKRVFLYLGNDFLGEISVPQSVQNFIRGFDRGKYLFLDSERPIE